jgi:dTDP-glucose 4,6-dehydratase
LLKNKLNTKNFRFIHVSTDEVYGSLKMNSPSSKENDVYNPSSPYSASKASADHLVNSWHLTYNFPSITTHCSNNYGPFQNKEKLIPLTITRLLNKKNIPIYGDGSNIRDWIHVDDHVDALILIQKKGILGNTYNIGSNTEISNLTLVLKICRILDKLFPFNKMHKQYITYVKDRLGHDLRYSINTLKINKKLNFKPKIKIEDGLKKTIKWYVEKFKI